MKSRVARLAAAAVILIAVLIGIYQGGGVESVALAEVFENMKKMPWMHQISTGFERGVTGTAEQWANFESNVWMLKGHDGKVNYWDVGRKERYAYDPASNTITVSRLKGGTPLDLSSPVAMLESMTEKLTEWGAEIVAKSGRYKGKVVAVQEISLTQNNISNKCRFFIDRKRRVLLGAQIKGTDLAGNVVMDGNIEFEYPPDGPKDIYALGVPATAKVVVEGTEPDVQLAAESKRVEAMFAARDIDGLVTMLAEAKFEEGRVLAANYLAQIGDSRAIEPLEILSAQWSGDEQDNPYAAAIREIKTRLEQETTDVVVKGDEDSTEDKAATSLTPALGLTGSGSVYDHFLFTRINKEDGQKKTKNLVIARVTVAGFELREIDTGPYDGKPGYRWEYPLCVVGGTLYCKEWSDSGKGLISLDLSTGETGRIGNLPELPLSYWSYLSPCCYYDGRLYALVGGTKTLQVLDFRKRAYRNIAAIEQCWGHEPIAVSPDHKRIALFAFDPNRSAAILLRIVNVESGEISYPIEPFESRVSLSNSFRGGGGFISLLPVIWLDGERVLFVRAGSSELPARLVCVNVTTGDMNDVTPLPGRSSPSEVPLIQDNTGAGPLIYKDDDDEDRYRVDVAAGKLVEDDCIGGDYYLYDGHLFDDFKELAAVKREDAKVSPDGKRVLWVSDGKLFYHDSAGEAPAPVLEQGTATGGYSLLWVKIEDLKAPAAAAVLPAGWIAFKDRPSEPRDKGSSRSPRPARENINDHLTFTVETDKDTYLHHEPVEVTLTVTSISDRDIELVAPVVFDPVTGSIVRLGLHYPNGSASIDCGAQPYAPKEENIVLRPGESVSEADILEVSRVGEYRIGCEYKGYKGNWQGKLGDSAAFEVKPIDSAEQERVPFEAKFNRLMEKFRYQRSIAPDWDGYQPTVADDIVGIRGMGAKVAPYLIEALKDENDAEAREVFYRTLTDVAGPEALSFFQGRLMHGSKDECKRACNWLYELYSKGKDGSAEALATLLSAMKHKNTDVRDKVAGVLNNIYDPNVESCFKRAVEDEDRGIRMTAARYLAAAEWLDLDEWLDVAAKTPTKARYLAARSIIKQLEKYWHISKGQLPKVRWEEVSKNPEKLEQYRKVVQAWQKWSNENPRYSSGFFDRDREHWGVLRPRT